MPVNEINSYVENVYTFVQYTSEVEKLQVSAIGTRKPAFSRMDE